MCGPDQQTGAPSGAAVRVGVCGPPLGAVSTEPTSVADAVRTAVDALCWLARADLASAPVAVQADCLRELERSPRCIPPPARRLSAFDAAPGTKTTGRDRPGPGCGGRPRSPAGPRPRRSAGCGGSAPTPPSPRRWPMAGSPHRGRRRSATGPTGCPKTPATTPTRSCSAPRPAAPNSPTWRGWPRRCAAPRRARRRRG